MSDPDPQDCPNVFEPTFRKGFGQVVVLRMSVGDENHAKAGTIRPILFLFSSGHFLIASWTLQIGKLYNTVLSAQQHV
jgi:hypothetical protein